MRKKLCAALLALALLAGHSAASATRIIFDDVPSTHWAFSYIQEAYLSHMVAGVGTDPQTGHMLFAPDKPIDAMSFTVLAANTFYAEETAQANGTTWFDAQYNVLLSHKAFNGLDVISLKDSIPRYQLVQVAYNILIDLGIHAPDHDATEAAKKSIGDWDSIPQEGQDAAAAMYALGVISGTGGKFEPMGTTDRAQSVVICMKMKEVLSQHLGTEIPTPPSTAPSASPAPSGSPAPEASTSPAPSTSPKPSNSPAPAESAEPSSSPAPTSSAAPSTSPEPTGSMAPDASTAPEESVEPSTSPEPSASPEPAESEAPEASSSPEPEASAAPDTEDSGTDTPESPAVTDNLPDAPPPKASAPTEMIPLA